MIFVCIIIVIIIKHYYIKSIKWEIQHIRLNIMMDLYIKDKSISKVNKMEKEK